MNDKPKVVVRDGKVGSDSIGKELARAHKLFCNLRDAGATHEDMKRLAKAEPVVFDMILAVARGIISANKNLGNGTDDCELINLDRDPGRVTDDFRSSFSFSMIQDSRLGIWKAPEDGPWGAIHKMIRVKSATGFCVSDRIYCRDNLVVSPKGSIDLNIQAARHIWWFGDVNPNYVQNLFEINGSDGCDVKIFFLGTVWKEWREKEVIYAAAITSDTEMKFNLETLPLPVGKWPSNCYVAVLVP